MAIMVCIVGCPKSLRPHIDATYLSDIRSRDPIVVDVPTLSGHSGRVLAKADGMKVYIMSYMFGYVTVLSDPGLTIQGCIVTIDDDPLAPMSRTPDVIVAEMLLNRSMVFIANLAINGQIASSTDFEYPGVRTSCRTPHFIHRTPWITMPTRSQLKFEPTPNDGIILVNDLRTIRLKIPTVDLICVDTRLCAIDNGVMVPVAMSDTNMEDGVVYEADVVKSADSKSVRIVKPRPRVTKKMSNPIDVVRRAVVSAMRDDCLSSALLDVTSMSFAIRERIYTLAQTNTSSGKNVIVIFGAGRFQEWKQMMSTKTSYITVDPEIDVTMLTKRAPTATVMPYDFRTPFNIQVMSIAKRPHTVLWAKCTSEMFIDRTMPNRFMVQAGMPAVFPFSLSYHIPVISRLSTERASTLGCGFVHDSISMTPIGPGRQSSSIIRATFGKSTYIEPYLSKASIPGLVLVKDDMPSL